MKQLRLEGGSGEAIATYEQQLPYMQQAWADVGIEVEIENYPAPSFFGGWEGVAWGRRYEMAQFSNGIFALQPNLADWWPQLVRAGVGLFYGRVPYVLGGNVAQTEIPLLSLVCEGSAVEGDPDAFSASQVLSKAASR